MSSRPALAAAAALLLSILSTQATAQIGPSPAPAPAPAYDPKLPPAASGARLIQAFIAGDTPEQIAPYFEDEIRPQLTEELVAGFRSQLTWIASVLGDALALFSSGTRTLPDGSTEFFREYTFAREADHKHPMVVIQVMFADSLVNRASGAFVKTFVPNQNERPIGGGRTWTVEGRKVEIHSLQLVDFEEGYLFAIRIEDADTVPIETREAAIPHVLPVVREAVARGWLDSARAATGGSPKPLLDEIGVHLVRTDPRMGYVHFRYTLGPDVYAAPKPAEPAKGKNKAK